MNVGCTHLPNALQNLCEGRILLTPPCQYKIIFFFLRKIVSHLQSHPPEIFIVNILVTILSLLSLRVHNLAWMGSNYTHDF